MTDAPAATADDLLEYLQDKWAEARSARASAKNAMGAAGELLEAGPRKHLRDNAPALIAKHEAELAELDRFMAFLRGLK